MYQYSRAIYLETRDFISAPSPDQQLQAQRRVLNACERLVGRLAEDPQYVADPARSLFTEIRSYFSINDQARIYAIIQRYVAAAARLLEEEAQRKASEESARCQAQTRKGTPCRRKPLPGRTLCPSHEHLASIVAV